MSTDDTSGGKSDVECPTCGREFDTGRGMKIHHSKAHGEKIGKRSQYNTSCPVCGRSDFKNELGVRKHRSMTHGEPVRESVDCAWCGESKKVTLYRARKYEKHFCNGSCQSLWQVENKSGENSPLWRPNVEVPCAWCGSIKSLAQSKASRSKNIFCDEVCEGMWLSENQSGPDNPNWKGGYNHPVYGRDWTDELREKIRERQDRQCVGCGMGEDENGGRLSVHHIRKARLVDDDEARNDDSFLVALCRSCHQQWEQMTPLRPQTPYLD